jgi:hypothetical protein
MSYDFTSREWTGTVRRVSSPPGTTVTVRSVAESFIPIRIRECESSEVEDLRLAFNYIHRRLHAEEYRKSLHVAMSVTNYCVTNDSRIGVGYTSAHNIWNQPLTILNARIFDRRVCSFEEFAVTVLHELLHVFESEDADKVSVSRKEALHDLACYALLRLSVPAEHWAFELFPDLRDFVKLARNFQPDEW